jgi:hypothetical protein
MPVPVTIFNANEDAIFVDVNNGGAIYLPGSGANFNWVPQQPNPNPFSFTTGNPGPNVFGMLAPNQVLLIYGRGPIWPALQINIPQTDTITSLQLYIFFQVPTMASWILLNAGAPIAWGTVSSDGDADSDE